MWLLDLSRLSGILTFKKFVFVFFSIETEGALGGASDFR